MSLVLRELQDNFFYHLREITILTFPRVKLSKSKRRKLFLIILFTILVIFLKIIVNKQTKPTNSALKDHFHKNLNYFPLNRMFI